MELGRPLAKREVGCRRLCQGRIGEEFVLRQQIGLFGAVGRLPMRTALAVRFAMQW